MKRWFKVILAIGLAVFVADTVDSWHRAYVHSHHPPLARNAQFITVEPNVELEVVDFGGTGRPIILLTGFGGTAHSFGEFSTKLTTKYHVYGITPRGFGLSSAPASGYTAKRLGDDVVAVIDTLKLVRPVLVGSSSGGEELSSVATFHPEKIAGLIYLDAGNGYALYDQVHGSLTLRVAAVVRVFEPLVPAALEPLLLKLTAGQMKFTELHVPVLAIFADPHDLSRKYQDPVRLAKAEALDFERMERQANAFQRQVPSARIVRLPHADHIIFRSNEADVLREMNAFIGSLPQ
ncbi:MAG TPA: alpha/beta hydrolase [Opitutaceae bacterium]|jgi:non-heme chloroperoxidase|nr:alpha/beta hydrolase [Opitutaceae bacterium]